jgi:endoglucanase
MRFGSVLVTASTAVLAVAAPATDKKKRGPSHLQWFGVNESGAEFGNTALPGQMNKDYTFPPTYADLTFPRTTQY